MKKHRSSMVQKTFFRASDDEPTEKKIVLIETSNKHEPMYLIYVNAVGAVV